MLGRESEDAYLKRRVEDYSVAKMIEHATPPDSRTLALLTVANAYLARDVAVSWQSAEADQLLDTLRLASLYSDAPAFDWRATWPEQPIRTVRFRMPAAYLGEWDINEVQLYSGDYRIFNSPQWTLSGWPNRWEAPLAFDGNLATRWRTWESVRAGMFMDIDMGHPQRLTLGRARVAHSGFGRGIGGLWTGPGRSLASALRCAPGHPAEAAGSAPGSCPRTAQCGLPLPAGFDRQRRKCPARQRHGGPRSRVGHGAGR